MKTQPLLDRKVADADKIFVQHFDEYPHEDWMDAEERSVFTGARATTLLALDPTQTWLPDDSWVRLRVPGEPHQGPSFLTRNNLAPERTLHVELFIEWLDSKVIRKVFWSAKTGFQPRLGALGLYLPKEQIILVWPDGTIRWLLVGKGPYGTGVTVFDDFQKFDANGNPHPMYAGRFVDPWEEDDEE